MTVIVRTASTLVAEMGQRVPDTPAVTSTVPTIGKVIPSTWMGSTSSRMTPPFKDKVADTTPTTGSVIVIS